MVGKCEDEEPLWRNRRQQEDNIEKDLKEVYEGVDWIDLMRERASTWPVVCTVTNNFRVVKY
jgi:hypothetical protein